MIVKIDVDGVIRDINSKMCEIYNQTFNQNNGYAATTFCPNLSNGDQSVTLSNVSFTEGDLFMPLNTTYKIALSLTPPNAFVERKSFTSSDTRIVTVDNKGIVTAVGEGHAIITFDVNI